MRDPNDNAGKWMSIYAHFISGWVMAVVKT